MNQETPQEDGQEPAALPREIIELLLEFSIGVHRFAMYPPGHPSQGPVAENIIGRLSQIFRERGVLSIGVAPAQLIIEGITTDEKHPVLSDLARRLHAHQIGALSFEKGVVVHQVVSVLWALAQDPERGGKAIGLLPADEIPTWEHVTLTPLGYDRLHLQDLGEGDGEYSNRATELWIGLAQAALASEHPMDMESTPDGGSLAKTIQEHQEEPAYDQAIVGYLSQLADELKRSAGDESEGIREQVSSLITKLDKTTLSRLVDMGGDFSQRKRFLLDANESLAVDSVMRILEAAAATSDQTISNSMARLLTKLAAHAEGGAARVRDQADTALRDNVKELLEDWELSDPNPDSYTLVLDSMARSAPVFSPSSTEVELAGRDRLVRMALEVDAVGPTVRKAVLELIEEGRVGYVLKMIDGDPPGKNAAAVLREFITNPTQFRRLLSGDDVESEALQVVVDRMGDKAIEPLLDALADSEARAVRRKVFDCLVGIGPNIRDPLMRRFEESRWFVLRNLLALVQHLEEIPEGFDAAAYMGHNDHRVRREAFPLALRDPRGPVRALAAALSDPDERMVRMALVEIQRVGAIQETLVPTLLNRVVRGDRDPEIQILGIRTLGVTQSSLARDALLDAVIVGKSLFGRPKLAANTGEVTVALSVLQSAWSGDSKVLPVLKVARRSRDPEIKAAVSGGGER